MKLLPCASCSIYSVSANTVNHQVEDRKSFLFLCFCNISPQCSVVFFPIQTQLSKAQEETGVLKLRLQTVSVTAITNCRCSTAFASAVAFFSLCHMKLKLSPSKSSNYLLLLIDE